MSHPPILYRKRLIPAECIRLENDRLLYQEGDQVLITQWRTLKPKKVLHHGKSCYLPKEGWKISQFLDADNNLICWYCDIIDTEYDPQTNTYIFVDLLADVLIYPDGRVCVVDLDEVADALDQKLITLDQMKDCMRQLSALLKLIYSESLFELEPIKKLMSYPADCSF